MKIVKAIDIIPVLKLGRQNDLFGTTGLILEIIST